MVERAGLLDSNILIDHLNGIRAARPAIEHYSARAISIVTWMEVLAGADPLDEQRTRLLTSSFDLLFITPEVAERAVSIRRQTRLKLPDAIILATAEIHGLVLVTRNARDFPPDRPGVHILTVYSCPP